MRSSLLCPACCWPLALAALCLSVTGCGPEPGIETYTVPRTDVLESPLPVRSPAEAPAGDDSQLVVMVQVGEESWFFKASGKSEAMEAHGEELVILLFSIGFDDSGDASWDLPEGWREEQGNSFRLATLRVGEGAEQVEVAISKLTRTTDDQQQLAELDSQRRDIVAERERLQQEIRDLSGKLFLVNHREQAIQEKYPVAQAVSGAAVGPMERAELGL